MVAVRVFQASEYEDSIDNNSVWSTGDWNCDGEFGSADLVRAFRESPYQRSAGIKGLDVAAAIVEDHGMEEERQKANGICFLTIGRRCQSSKANYFVA